MENVGTALAGNGINIETSSNRIGDRKLSTPGYGAIVNNSVAVGYQSLPCWGCLTVTGMTTVGDNVALNCVSCGTSTILGNNVASTTYASGVNDILAGVDSTTDTATASTSGAVGIGRGVHPGTNDVAIGTGALANTASDNLANVGIGYEGCTAVTSGGQLFCGGNKAGAFATTATASAFTGYLSGGGNSGVALTGSFNTANGANALTNIQGAANHLTGAGYDAGGVVTTGSFSTYLGASVGGTGCVNCAGQILIGVSSNTVNSNSNVLMIEGNSSTTIISATGTNTPTTGLFTINSPVVIGATKFTTSGCSISATAGQGTSGTYTSGTSGTCTAAITLNGATGITAPNGWICTAYDRTTPADTQLQTVSATTGCTVAGTTVSGDVVAFYAQPY